MRALPLLLLSVAISLAACASPSSTGDDANATSGSPIVVSDATVRLNPASSMAGMGLTSAAMYMTIHNNGADADRLVGVKGDFADSFELHESTSNGDVMGMQPVDGIDVPAGGDAVLETGGYHVMVMGPHDLGDGDTVSATLVFDKAGEVPVTAEVRTE